jgi:hypothetical protein
LGNILFPYSLNVVAVWLEFHRQTTEVSVSYFAPLYAGAGRTHNRVEWWIILRKATAHKGLSCQW